MQLTPKPLLRLHRLMMSWALLSFFLIVRFVVLFWGGFFPLSFLARSNLSTVAITGQIVLVG